MVGRMIKDYGITLSQLNECLCGIPIFKENIAALKLTQAAGAMNFVLSDANHHYISIILEHHNISSLFVAVETNLSCFEEELSQAPDGTEKVCSLLRISPHQPADTPHHCPLCPHNLCKGNVLDMWRDQYALEKIVYVGDGGGDFCPALRLSHSDVVLCRSDFPLHKRCSATLAGEQSQHQLSSSVQQWSCGKDILSYFEKVFEAGESIRLDDSVSA